MGGLWRLTRNRYGRRVYESLHDAGITATWMLEYVAEFEDGSAASRATDSGGTNGWAAAGSGGSDVPPGTGPTGTDGSVTPVPEWGPSGGLSVEVCDPERVAPLDPPTEQLRDDEEVLGAVADGAALGYLFLSVDATHDVHPLERSVRFDGAYVRRVFVDPERRGRGVGSALVAGACRRARERGAARATALVAFDNRPSRRLFAKHGFRPRRDRAYVRLGPLSYSHVRDRG